MSAAMAEHTRKRPRSAGLEALTESASGKAGRPKPGDIVPRGLFHSRAATEQQQEILLLMILDVDEESDGSFLLWGTSDTGASCLVRVTDFQPYFYIAAPRSQENAEPSAEDLQRFKQHFNRHLPSDSQIDTVEWLHKTPIMYYRPTCPDGSRHLQLIFKRGANLRKASSTVHKAAASARIGGWAWQDRTLHEHEVSLLQRFLTDTLVSGGAWVSIALDSCSRPTPPDEHAGRLLSDSERISSCAIEARVPWRALCCLTPDATQLADADWAPHEPAHTAARPGAHDRWRSVAAQARAGDIAPLRLMAIDVVCATHDGQDRVPVPAKDPVVAIACVLFGSKEATLPGMGGRPSAEDGDEGDQEEMGQDDMQAQSEAHQYAGHASAGTPDSRQQVVFTWAPSVTAEERQELSTGACVKAHASEAAMLKAWHDFFDKADPDAIPVFQVKDNLGILAERWKVVKLDGGAGLRLSRMAGRWRKPLALRKITQYSAAWVKSQARMSSTSNQETYRADIEGRLVFDILRQALTSCNLASFSLVDCVQSLMGRTLEVLPPSYLAALASLSASQHVPEAAQARLFRLARYSLARADAVCSLLRRLATIPETFELARATGLTCPQAQYNAQMIRTLSLLLRNARRLGYIVGGRQEPVQLVESPFLIHPVETGAVKLYREPVIILDFASLYPSLFRAHNLCYTTLLHPDDAASVPAEAVTTTPTGAKFVRSGMRPGVLPSILAALISARSATRAALKELPADDVTTRAVLDSRQKALKLIANALYGFTGAQASPLQCTPLADSCLALGAASCRRAKEILEDVAAAGRLGEGAQGAKVVYAQTDSLFAHLPNATGTQALSIGGQAAKLVTAAFPAEMELKFERMCLPFMLLHVNRYAGRAFDTAEQLAEGKGSLMIKGLKSTWRQAAPIVRTTLHGAISRILMQDDVSAAVAFVADEIRRLLSGGCNLSEFVMTGGLWRLTGQQVAAAAAEEGASAPAAGKADDDADVRGPHAALAVRMQKRDPGRVFVLGERLLYVLLAGVRLQDDAAEDPLTAARQGSAADYDLYWRNKLLRPLSEVFAVCLPPAGLQELLHGPHTMVRVDHAASSAPTSPLSPGKKGGRGGGRQTGLGSFYKSTLKCLNCKRSIPYSGEPPGPGLCSDCTQLPGVRETLHVQLVHQQKELEARHGQTWSACMHCHSGGATGAVTCSNGECSMLFRRLDSASRLGAVTLSLKRLDW